ncbi:hypothetical protein ACFPOI_37635 [Nonomuraea angiospora]|uniref:Secreted protein n=1 Tax=Nonomuraea angiospora TaxID=46172 RepID=A0ABR9M0X2_9ACTN|nr:hypothetical protein [Nonomuraea angiospora]MBE1586552.1 hypothetical protein [Nonomuraea angiospora]
MRKSRTATSVSARASVVAAGIAALIVWPMGTLPAHADPAPPQDASIGSASPDGDVEVQGGCVGNICGSVMNESSRDVWAIRNFTADGPESSSKWRRLAPGEETPRDQDWDGFYVACKASGRIATWTPPGVWVWKDFSLPAGYWMKISTHQDAHVRSQSC